MLDHLFVFRFKLVLGPNSWNILKPLNGVRLKTISYTSIFSKYINPFNQTMCTKMAVLRQVIIKLQFRWLILWRLVEMIFFWMLFAEIRLFFLMSLWKYKWVSFFTILVGNLLSYSVTIFRLYNHSTLCFEQFAYWVSLIYFIMLYFIFFSDIEWCYNAL